MRPGLNAKDKNDDAGIEVIDRNVPLTSQSIAFRVARRVRLVVLGLMNLLPHQLSLMRGLPSHV
jgi:hypothetical protein